MQPVGKSGPWMYCRRSSVVAPGLSMTCIAASQTSRRLCGGMLVAIPTAMPSVPLSRRFGTAVGITVYRAEISLPDDERVAHSEILGHLDHRIVHSRIAMRMILADDVADDRRRLASLCRYGESRLVHRKEDAAMHGLQSVAHIRECACR